MNAGPMSFRRRWLSPAIALTVAACAAGTAQTVTVEVQGVPLNELIEQLKLNGDVEILTRGLPADLLEQPVSYKAEDVPVKPDGECEVRLKLVTPLELTEVDPERLHPLADLTCAVVGDDGIAVDLLLRASSIHVPGGPNNQGKRRVTYASTWRSSRLPAGTKPAKVAFGFFAKSDETKRIPFQFENIPLPTWGQ